MYYGRQLILNQIGYCDYDTYQMSSLWATIRLRVLTEAAWTCCVCKGNAQAVHHVRYTLENLAGTCTKHLRAVCNGCHYAIEFTEDGEKRTEKEARDQFYQLMRTGSRKKTKQELKEQRKRRKGKGRPEIGLAHKRKHQARNAGR